VIAPPMFARSPSARAYGGEQPATSGAFQRATPVGFLPCHQPNQASTPVTSMTSARRAGALMTLNEVRGDAGTSLSAFCAE